MKSLFLVGLCCLIAVAYAAPNSIAANEESEDQIDEATAQSLDRLNEAEEQDGENLNDLADIEDYTGNEQNDIANREDARDIEEQADLEGADSDNEANKQCWRHRRRRRHRVRSKNNGILVE